MKTAMTETTPPSASATSSAPVAGSGQDQCLTFLLHGGAFRGRFVRLDQTLSEILGRHNYPPVVARLVAETAVTAVVLAFAMKFDGIFTLQARGDGPVRMLVADVLSDGTIRAYASFDEDAVAALTATDADPGLHRLLGTGTLVFTVDLDNTMEGANNRYQGIVPLEDATLSDCIHRYFRQSEQLETAIKIHASAPSETDTEGQGWSAGALMVQRMPRVPAETRSDEELDDLWRTAVVLLGSLTSAELIDPGLTAHDVLYRLFHQENLGVYVEARQLTFGCRCSRERVALTLRSFGDADLAEMRQDDGTISAQCQFCSTTYVFNDAEIAALKD